MNQELKDTNVEKENDGWAKFGGLFLILLGGIFLLGQSGVKIMGQSPWMLFALMPVFWIVAAAWRQYVENGRQLNRKIVALLTWGLFPFIYVAAALFGFNAALIWPLALVFTGIGIIFYQRG